MLLINISPGTKRGLGRGTPMRVLSAVARAVRASKAQHWESLEQRMSAPEGLSMGAELKQNLEPEVFQGGAEPGQEDHGGVQSGGCRGVSSLSENNGRSGIEHADLCPEEPP